jgi:RNA polymerase sigma-70 factor (ECF subfamily)
VYRTGLNWGRSSLRSLLRRRRRERLVAEQQMLADRSRPAGDRTELMEALATLSLDHRAVVVLRYYCDWSVAETAAALEIAEGTVQSRCSRALDQLRDLLGTDKQHHDLGPVIGDRRSGRSARESIVGGAIPDPGIDAGDRWGVRR